ncbi:hypothetical protein ACIBQ1_33950 [Nonomuraea sp. NPDC050153]|uniref:hypothetical protein n=1 Tax=Nonomuraea sp. NPDC050153 TaxID=3364359 RepID=UPI0037A6D3D0
MLGCSSVEITGRLEMRMQTRTWTRRTAASATALVALLALCTTPASANAASSANTNVVRPPQCAMVLADGESGAKRPV